MGTITSSFQGWIPFNRAAIAYTAITFLSGIIEDVINDFDKMTLSLAANILWFNAWFVDRSIIEKHPVASEGSVEL